MSNSGEFWSLSKFGDWLRDRFGCEKMPPYATSDEWHQWNARNCNNIGYKLAESLDTIRSVVMWIPDSIESTRCYIRNRFITKTHTLRTNLPPGRWYDLDIRIPNAIFYELYRFVCDEMGATWFSQNTELGRKEFSLIADSDRLSMGMKMLDLQVEWNRDEGLKYQQFEKVIEIVNWWADVDKDSDWERTPEATQYMIDIINIRESLWT